MSTLDPAFSSSSLPSIASDPHANGIGGSHSNGSVPRSTAKIATLGTSAAPHVAFSSWSLSSEKRIFDLLIATAMVCLCSPVMLMAAALVKISSPGPVLFRQKRVGLKGIVFTMFKFRSMTVERPDKSRGMTRAGDARITPVGRILRKWKIDELPQLWNVIRGEMSLVGPRPYLAEYFGSLSPAQRQIFRVRPAVTGAATLCYRNEEHCLAAIPEAELRRYYLTHLLPEKLEMDLQYMRVASIWSDLRILLGTARVLLAAVNKPPEVTPLQAPISDTQRAA